MKNNRLVIEYRGYLRLAPESMKCNSSKAAKETVAKRNTKNIISAIWHGPGGGKRIIIALLMLLMVGSINAQLHEDDIRNPENHDFVVEVAFNNDIEPEQVTQAQFNERYLGDEFDPWTHYTYKTFSTDNFKCHHDHVTFIDTKDESVTFKIIDDIISIEVDEGRTEASWVILNYEIKSDGEDIKYTCYDYAKDLYTIYIESEDHLIHVRPWGTDDMILHYSTYHYD